MRRVSLTLSAILMLVVSGCAASTDPTQPDGTTTTVTTPSTTQSESEAPSAGEPTDTTTTVGEAPEARPDGPAAPDFTLALGADGASTFSLSQEVKPVFMVFWAEW